MTDVEIRLGADVSSATRNIGSFRSEYKKLVREVERPLNQITAFRDFEDAVSKSGAAAAEARSRVRELGNELARTENPTRAAQHSYRDAVNELNRLERAEAQQKIQLRNMREELQRAGYDTSKLAQEQAKLRQSLSQRLNAGRNDAALTGSMDTFGVSKLRDLQARLAELPKSYERLALSGRLSAKEQVVAQQQLQKQLALTRAELDSLSDAQAEGGGGSGAGGAAAGAASAGSNVSDMIGAGLKGFVAIGAVEAVSGFVSIADSAKKFEAQLKLATNGQEEFNTAQEALKHLASENQAPLGSLYQLYARISPAMQEAGKSQADTLGVTEAVTAAMRISGATAAESENAIIQFAQALGAGALRGDEFNSVAEQAPRLMRALADGLGVTRGALKGMAADGKLTADVVVDGLLKVLPELREEASQLPQTFEGSMTALKNESLSAVEAFDSLIGFTDGLTHRLKILSFSLGKVSDYLSAFNKEGLKGVTRQVNEDVVSQSISYWQGRAKAIREAMNEIDDNGRVSITSFASLGMWDKGQLDSALKEAEQHAEKMQKVQQKMADDQKVKLTEMQQQIKQYNSSVADLRRSDIGSLKSTADLMVAAAKRRNQQLAELERAALSDSQKAYKDRAEIEQKYKDTFTKLTDSGTGSDYGDAQQLKVSARNSLQSGDAESALRSAEKARQVLLSIQESGGNTYGLLGVAKELEQIELAANKLQQTKADQKLSDVRSQITDLKEATKDLKNLTITTAMDDASVADVRGKVKALAKELGAELILTVGVQPTPEMLAAGMNSSSSLSFPTDVAKGGKSDAEEWRVPYPYQGSKQPSLDAAIKAGLEPIIDSGAKQEVKDKAAELGEGAEIPVMLRPITDAASLQSLPSIEVKTELDTASVTETKNQVDQFAGELPKQIEIPIVPKYYASSGGAGYSQFPASSSDSPGYDGGGYTGPGGKYEPAGTVHRGEHVQPQEVVREPGALGFLERVRLYGFRNTMEALRGQLRQGWRGYATGGLVAPRLVPSIPALGPSLSSADEGEGLGTVILHLDGQSYRMQAQGDQFVALHRTALKKGNRRKN